MINFVKDRFLCFRKIVLFFILLFFVFLANHTVSAESIIVEQPLFNQDNTIKGNSNNIPIIKNLSSYSNVDKNSPPKLKIHYQVSDANDLDSYLTIAVNQVAVKTIPISKDRLNSFDNTETIVLDNIDWSVTKQVKIELYPYISKTGDRCIDRYDSSLWFTIKGDSALIVTYEDDLNLKEIQSPLANFPNNLVHPLNPNIKLVYPKDSSSEDRNLLIRTISYLGRLLQLNSDQLHIINDEEFMNGNRTGEVLFVGNPTHFAEEIQTYFESFTPILEKNEGILSVINPNHDFSRRYYLLGIKDGSNIDVVFNRLADQKFLYGQTDPVIPLQYSFESLVEDSKDTNGDSKMITLSDMGYDDLYLNNMSDVKGSLRFVYQFSPGEKLNNQSKLVLYHDYNKTFASDYSTLTIIVNGQPIHSIHLEDVIEKTESNPSSIYSKLEVPIPENLIDGNQIVVDIQYHFLDHYVYSCDQNPRLDGWAIVSKDSFLEVDFQEKAGMNLDFFPAPFIKDSKWNNLAVILPTKSTSVHYQQLANTMMSVAPFSKSDNGLFLFLEDEFSDDVKYQHNILFHHAWGESEFLKGNQLFPIKKDEATNQLLFEGSSLDNQFSSLLSQDTLFWTLAKSPWKNDYFVSLLSTLNVELMNQTDVILNRNKMLNYMNSEHMINNDINTFLIYKDGNMMGLNHGKQNLEDSDNVEQSTKDISNAELNSSSSSLLQKIFRILLIIATVLLFVAIWTVEKRKKG